MIVVTGTGRSGTKYMAQALTAVGIRCGHEQVFTPHGRVPSAGYDASSSWMAVPYITLDDVVIHVIRNPRDCIASMLTLPFFVNTPPWAKPYYNFMRRHVPDLPTDDPVAAAEHFYVTWNRRAAAVADVTCDLRDVRWDFIAELANRPVDIVIDMVAEIPTTVNTRGPSPDYEPSEKVLETYEEFRHGVGLPYRV